MSQTKAQLLDGSVVSVAFSAGSAAAPSVYYSADTTTGIYFPGSGQLAISTNGTGRVFVDSSGRLLVGTSSSTQTDTVVTGQLQIQSSTTSQRGISQLHTINDASATFLQLSKIRGISIVQSDDYLGRIQFNGYDGAVYRSAATIDVQVDGTPGTGSMPGRLVFSTTASGSASPTERMRIASNGQVYIGATTNPTGGFARTSLLCSAQSSSHYGVHVNALTTISCTLIQFTAVNTAVGTITTDGTSSVSYNTSSDYRLKENVVPLTSAIDRFNQLKPYQFNFITNPGKTVDGFLAHEAQAVVPECVTGTKDEVNADGKPVYQGIDQAKLVPLLTAALQEALQKIEQLEQRLTDAGL